MFTKSCISMLGICSLCVLLLSAKYAFAEDGMCTGVEVVYAGAAKDGKAVKLKNTRTDCGNWAKDNTMWFYLDNSGSNANGMLAAALSAQTNGKPVLIIPKNCPTPSTCTYSSWSYIMQLYATK